MSNINALKIHVIAGLSSYDLEVGRAGEVQAEDIKWVRSGATENIVSTCFAAAENSES